MSRKLAVLVAIVAAIPAVLLVHPAGGGQQAGTITLEKTVVGPVPAGTTFTVEVDCEGSTSETEFDETGGVVSGSATRIVSTPATCTVTETVQGGADSVTYSCTDDGGGNCSASGPQAAPMTVDFPSVLDEATVTVTNTYDPDAPAPVTAAPTTTG